MTRRNIFVLSWKKLWILVIADILAIILHNLVSGVLGTEEALFFILAVFIIPVYLVISTVWTVIRWGTKKGSSKEDV